ncbi:hypothetical protein [Cryobacterium ruanii]|uniref:MalT-like winged helix domain-containing protein n=1 Tax=Cryobacterium ruanii TaxID=1259197 RepID=A0A4R9AMQ6_9MICO|nr:hypothetical protein [Cryobacterium ruanii]TFD65394.1 hypothetical protein E3T47_11275 [Cryobacterium ruanii]
MSTRVLATKLFVPARRPQAVARARLIERLREGRRAGHRLSLTSAPAGFGKTTLLSEWIAAEQRDDPASRVAWLSLDAGDSDPGRFLTYLAAVSLRERSDATEFIEAFTGSHRFVLDYLVEEVLKGLPAPVRDFLLETAILDRLSGPLCEAVTGQPAGGAMLESLERANLFVLPLDDHRQWYR